VHRGGLPISAAIVADAIEYDCALSNIRTYGGNFSVGSDSWVPCVVWRTDRAFAQEDHAQSTGAPASNVSGREADPTGAQGKPASLTGSVNSSREIEMNQHRLAGNRKQLKGESRGRSKRTIAPLKAAGGTRDQLGDRVQEPYGISNEEAARQLDGFLDRTRDWDD